MFRLLFLLFLIIPAVEIALFIQIGGVIGVALTLLLVAFTAILGIILLRMQGLITLARIQEHLSRGKIPAVPLIEGAILLVAGAFLLTPGFFTDTVGFAALVPPIREHVATWLLSYLHVVTIDGGRPRNDRHAKSGSGDHYTIEGEYQRKD